MAGLAPAIAAVPQLVEPGSPAGEMAMLVEQDYASTIVARDRVFCLEFMREVMHAQVREDATLAEHFAARLTKRLLQTAEELRRIDRVLVARAGRLTTGTCEMAGRNQRTSLTQVAASNRAHQGKAPNPGGGVGREKRVMRMVPGGNPAPQTMSFG